MSNRKLVTASVVAPTSAESSIEKLEIPNTPIVTISTTPETNDKSDDIKDDMGSNVSANATDNNNLTCSDIEPVVNCEDSTITKDKDSSKSEIKLTNTEQKRITRNSPLLTSPTVKKDNRIDNNVGGECELTNSESEESGTAKKHLQIRGRKSLKDSKNEAIKKDNDNSSCDVGTTEKEMTSNASKDLKEPKDTKEKEVASLSLAHSTSSTSSISSTISSAIAATSSRVTRKVAAQELFNTRVTRNRQASVGRSETPPIPARTRRAAAGKKSSVQIVDPVGKRKRSIEESSSSNVEPGAKYIKIELKEDLIEAANESVSTVNEVDSGVDLHVKAELTELDEMTVTEAMPTTNVAPTNAGRGRGRWGSRKSHGSGIAISPSTRMTRNNKLTSPSTAMVINTTGPDGKKRRLASSNTITRSSSTNLLKTPIAANAQDEDSKDSIASSMDDILMADIKSEKLTPDLSEYVDSEIEEKSSNISGSTNENKPMEVTSIAANGPSESLLGNSVDAIPIADPASGEIINKSEGSTALAVSTDRADVSEKATSLSPELISEELSEISVKHFYKKPEFLENNLGIEEDPKLGEIVQKVSTEKDDDKILELVVTKDKDTPKLDEEDFTILKDDLDAAKECSTDAETGDNLAHGNSPSELEAIESDYNKNEQSEVNVTIDIKEDNIDENPNVECVDVDKDAPVDGDELEEMEPLECSGDLDEDDIEVTADIEEKKDHLEKTNNIPKCDNDEAKLKDKIDTANEATNMMDLKIEKMEQNEAELVSKIDNGDSDDELCAKALDSLNKTENIELNESVDIASKLDEENIFIKKEETTSEPTNETEPKLEILNELSGVLATEDDKENIDITTKDNISDIEQINEEKTTPDSELEEAKEENELVLNEDTIATAYGKMNDDDHADGKENDTEDMESNENDMKDDLHDSSPHTSPSKFNANRDDDATSMKSDSNSWVTLDLDNDEEVLRQKEQHLQNLGLLTHKAAEKRRQEFIQNSAAAVETRITAPPPLVSSKRNGKSSTSNNTQEYTGTLKTVIKLNRSSSSINATTLVHSSNSRKSGSHPVVKDASNSNNCGGIRRQSLKITFQKGRGRGQGNSDRSTDQNANGEDAYYTIQNENEGAIKSTVNSNNEHANVQSHGRKTHNRSNNNNNTTNTTNSASVESSHSEGGQDVQNVASSKKDEKEKILIPEKASSFKFHPGRLCEDQCFYCSGKFGLYDTPCHVGQIKSSERQQKILENEEKLTVDNCLCDACFRHVDRRANVPSYKKRISATGQSDNTSSSTGSAGNVERDGEDTVQLRKCLVPDCTSPAGHSLRRKCIRKSVKKFLLKFDIPTGLACVWLCQSHYDTVIQCSGCVLCKRRLGKNHMYHITSDTDRLEKALAEMGIPVQLGIGTAVCKLCRYFANLLMKPPESTKSQKAEFVKNYRKRLLQFHNIHEGSNEASEEESNEIASSKSPQKKKSVNIKIAINNDAPSPLESMGSSVECLGETDDAPLDVNKSNAHQQHMLLDNDVLVDYDVPMISTDSNSSSCPTPPNSTSNKEMSKLKAILQNNATKSANINNSTTDLCALRFNPDISMRELFPGEEDLGLHFKAAFGSNTSQRTPEGWTRVQTFLQYDEPTRQLWEELQKPYGNQSSFLRHLILLEKYYRNGDLILSQNASSNASVYTRTVRQRLVSYDQGHYGDLQAANSNENKEKTDTQSELIDAEKDVDDNSVEKTSEEHNTSDADGLQKHSRSRSVSVDKLTKQLNTNAVTIIARPKDTAAKTGDSILSKSLLKDKNLSNPNITNSNSTATTTSNATTSSTSTLANKTLPGATAAQSNNSRSILKSNLLGMNKSIEILPLSSASSSSIGQSNPTNKNISINHSSTDTKQQKILEVANKLLGNQLEATANTTGSTSTSSSSATNMTASTSLLNSPPELVSLHRRPSGTAGTPATTTNSSLLNPKRGQQLSKPNLIRGIPPNVVVLPDTLSPQERMQSKSWRPTLMPVEENQHLLNKGGPLYQTADGRRLPALVQVQSGGKPFLISIFDYNRMCILRREKLLRDQMLKSSKNRQDSKNQTNQQQQQHQHQHGQKTTGSTNIQNTNKNTSAHKLQQQQQQQQQFHRQQAAQQQLLQLQMMQREKQNASTMSGSGRYQPVGPKMGMPSSSNGGSGLSSSSPNNFASPMMPLFANAFSNAAAAGNSNPSAAFINAAWLLNNYTDSNPLHMNGQPSSMKLPKLIPKPNSANNMGSGLLNTSTSTSIASKQHQLSGLDNTLMSKIPKSLTVIPQHKLMQPAANSGGPCNQMGHKE